ncbi:5819_t:CDS:10 [Funneliformis mosseae]|uniref:5819_t:CDS:1 n=1 Tax=Funneliformis mosseae TaxID=27381 RepID=A0A9N8ZKN3_FUNMO|nr:5819_t:CDS:10 [Funneliformis mosseae]
MLTIILRRLVLRIYRLETENITPTWTDVLNGWKDSLEAMINTNHIRVPNSVKHFCKELLNFNTFEGETVLERCMKWYNNFYERYCDLQLAERVQHIEEKIYSSQKLSEMLQGTENKKRPQDDTNDNEAGPSNEKRSRQDSSCEGAYQDDVEYLFEMYARDEEEIKAMDVSSVEWEFNYPIHDWLNKVINEQKTMMSQIGSNIASKPLLWRIIDLSYSEVAPSTLSQNDQVNVRKLISSALWIGQPNEWTVLVPPAERCLGSLAKLTTKQLKKIAKTVKPNGIHGAVLEIRNILTSSEVEESNPFLIVENKDESNKNLIREEDHLNKDVSYILELLRYTYEMIDIGIPQRHNSERDIDVFIKSTIFSCFNGIVDRHFGETVSRASRDRRRKAIDASSYVEGYHIDWLFTRHDLAKDMTWGREFSLCERAGSRIENHKKILDNTLKVQKTLKDMHKTLIDTIVMTSGGTISKEVLDVIPKMLMPGFLSSRFFIRMILIMYVGAGFYLSAELAEFDIPTAYEELGGVLKMARVILQAKRMLFSTVTLFASTKERAEREKFLLGKVLLPDRPKECSSPMKSKNKKCREKINYERM